MGYKEKLKSGTKWDNGRFLPGDIIRRHNMCGYVKVEILDIVKHNRKWLYRVKNPDNEKRGWLAADKTQGWEKISESPFAKVLYGDSENE